MTEYDAKKDSFDSYNVAIAAKRAQLLMERCPAAKRVEVIGQCTLYLGDCLDIMPVIGRVNAVVTDPPYGIGEDGGRFRGRKGQNIRVLEKGNWDSATPPQLAFDLMLSCSDEQIIWGGNYFTDKLPPSKGWLYWQKLMGGDFADGELAWTSRDRALREFTKCPKGQGAVHPTQKPIEVMKWCLEFLPQAELILDPFMGSGTTGVACAKSGRSFVGIEQHEPYFDIACERIRKAYDQPDLFIAPKQPKPKQEALL
jgi:DNA modification methylase